MFLIFPQTLINGKFMSCRNEHTQMSDLHATRTPYWLKFYRYDYIIATRKFDSFLTGNIF